MLASLGKKAERASLITPTRLNRLFQFVYLYAEPAATTSGDNRMFHNDNQNSAAILYSVAS